MVDSSESLSSSRPIRRGSLYIFLRQRSTIAFMMVLPLLLIIGFLVAYPFFYSIYLSTLNKAETAFVGISNFLFLFKRETCWMVVQQSVTFALIAVVFKALIGVIAAHAVNNIPSKANVSGGE